MQVEGSSENENDDADGVYLSGLDIASTVHTNVVANGNEDEPNILIECDLYLLSQCLNETTDKDREEEDDPNLEIDEATDFQGETAGTSNGQESAG